MRDRMVCLSACHDALTPAVTLRTHHKSKPRSNTDTNGGRGGVHAARRTGGRRCRPLTRSGERRTHKPVEHVVCAFGARPGRVRRAAAAVRRMYFAGTRPPAARREDAMRRTMASAFAVFLRLCP